MTPRATLAALADLGVRIVIDAEAQAVKLRPASAVPPDLIDAIKAIKPELIALGTIPDSAAESLIALLPAEPTEVAPVAPVAPVTLREALREAVRCHRWEYALHLVRGFPEGTELVERLKAQALDRYLSQAYGQRIAALWAVAAQHSRYTIPDDTEVCQYEN